MESSEDEDFDAHTFRVLAPSLVPGGPPAASRGAGARSSSVHSRAAFAGSGTESAAEAEIEQLRRELHLDGGARSPVMGDIEGAFGRYASRPSSARSRPPSSAARMDRGKTTGHPRRRLAPTPRAAALGTPGRTNVNDTQRLVAAAVEEAHREVDGRVSAAVAEVRREAAEQLAHMQAEVDARAREMAQQMAAAMVETIRAEAIEQLRAEMRTREPPAGRYGGESSDAPPLLVSRAFRGWRSSAHRQAEYKARLRRLMCHFSHFSLAVALRGWKAGVAWLRRARGLLEKAGRRIRVLVVSSAWDKWCDATRRVRMGRRALARLVHGKVGRAFERWRQLLLTKMEAAARLEMGEVVVLETQRVDEQRTVLSSHRLRNSFWLSAQMALTQQTHLPFVVRCTHVQVSGWC